MRLMTTLLVLAAGLAISVAVYVLTGGRFVFLLLPLVLGLPLVWRRKG
jgi:hypothetical protein